MAEPDDPNDFGIETEEGWLNAEDPEALTDFLDLHVETAVRKSRLIACAACRQVWHYFDELPELRAAVEVGERYADGAAFVSELRDAGATVQEVFADLRASGLFWRADVLPAHRGLLEGLCNLMAEAVAISVCPEPDGWGQIGWFPSAGRAASRVVEANYFDTAQPLFGSQEQAVAAASLYLANVVRDVMGNPFRQAWFSPTWRSSTVVELARSLYESRNFSPMPVLADALEEAGCDDPVVLNHCRGYSPHVRGCWVVDFILDHGSPPTLVPEL